MSIFSFFRHLNDDHKISSNKTFGKRHFLKSSLLALAGVVIKPKWVWATKMHPQWIMIIDLNRCIGCQSCVIACKAQCGTVEGQFNTRVLINEQKEPPAAGFIPVLCNQCENAPCINACPREATFRQDTGIVVTDWELCDGSGNCLDACPYGARFLDPIHGNRSDKCDFCIDRIQMGLVPACVEACAPQARIFGDASTPSEELRLYLMRNDLEVNRPELKLRGSVFYLPLKKSKHKERS
jgi:tetrathionate reductase subunit B